MIMKRIILGAVITAGLLIPTGALMANEKNVPQNNRPQQTCTELQNRVGTENATQNRRGYNNNKINPTNRDNSSTKDQSRTRQMLQDGSGENCDGTCRN